MSTISPASCPQCGAPLPPDAPQGLCPRCLMNLNFASQSGPAEPAAPAPSVEEIARHFPQLEILECLGRGGMGLVYKARQPTLNRFVALKILAPERERDPAFAERFTHEARALAKLSHPNIVTVHDFGVADNLFYLVMEFVDGMNLRELMTAARISPREALAIVPQICDALQYAHDHGVIHRDIKPENILLDRQGRVKVADFGLAKLVETTAGVAALVPSAESSPAAGTAAATLTTAGQVMGTPQYMAPEQVAHPSDVDHRADIYSLGVVFYQMLTGELPGAKLEPPSRKVVVDVRLDEVVLRALEQHPARRYQQVSDVKTMCETIAASRPAPRVTESPPPQAPRISLTTIVCACLMLDALLVPLCMTATNIFVTFYANPELENRAGVNPALVTKLANQLSSHPAILFPVLAAILIAVDILIIRAVWRAVNKPVAPPRADAHIPTIGQEAPANFQSQERSGSRPAAGWWRVPLVVAIVFYAAFVALLLFTADALPGRVASHFDENGQPNGWMSRTGHIEFMAILPLAIGVLFAGIVAMIRKLPQGLINIPRKDFWLAPGRRDLTASIIASRFAWFYGLLLCFFGGLHVLTLKANSAQPAQLPMGGFLFLVIGFLITTMMWTILLITRFAEAKDPRGVTPGGTSARSSDVSAPPRFSRTAIVGSCLMALGVLSAVLSLFVDRMVASVDGLAQPHHPASPAALALISAALLYGCFATLLGWIAVTQISRSAGKLYGLGLAVFDGLFLPLLALDALILSTGVGLDVSLVIIVLADIFIIRAVWHAVNKPVAPPVLPPAHGVTAPPPSPEAPTIGNAAPSDFQSLETTNAVLMTPEELGTARGQFGMAFTRGPLVLDGTRLVHRGNGKETVIPLAAIEDVSLGHFPRAMNPRHMELVCVTYRLDGRSHRIVFAPWERMVGLPSLFNDRVRAWHQLVRSAVHRNTGRVPTETAEAQLNLPRSSPLTVAVMASPYVFGIGALWASAAIQSAGHMPSVIRWLLWIPAVPLLVMALAWITPKRRATTSVKPRSVLLALLLPVLVAAIGVGSFVVGMLLRPNIQPPIGPFKVHCTPEGVTGRVVLVRMFTPDPLVRQEVRMHLEGPELPVEDLQIPRNFTHRPRPDYFIFPRPSPAIQPWTDFGSAKQTLMGFVLPTPELAQEAWRRLGMGAQPMAFDRDRPPGAFHFDLDPTRPEYLKCVLFDVTNAVGKHFTGKLLFSATWVRAGHPRWAEMRIRPIKKSLNTIELAWEVVTEKPAAMTLRHRWQDGGSETMAAFTQSSPNVHASVLVYKMTDTRVGMRMTLGDQPSTKEFDGNFEAIAEELGVYSGSGRIKTERDWDIELCRVAGGPVYLHISDLKEPERVVGSQGRR